MTYKFVTCNPVKCIGCRLCELACSSAKEKVLNPSFSRIRTVSVEPTVSLSVACRLCDDPICVASCPTGSLSVDGKTGVIRVDDLTCCSCGWCTVACKWGAITSHPSKRSVAICDLCDGDPECVKFCPKDALSLGTVDETLEKLDNEPLKKLMYYFWEEPNRAKR